MQFDRIYKICQMQFQKCNNMFVHLLHRFACVEMFRVKLVINP